MMAQNNIESINRTLSSLS